MIVLSLVMFKIIMKDVMNYVKQKLIITLLTISTFNLIGMWQTTLQLINPVAAHIETDLEQLALQPAVQVQQATRGDLKVFLALPHILQQQIISWYLKNNGYGLLQFQELKTLTGHTDWVRSVTKFRDNRIASASNDRTIKIWERPKSEVAVEELFSINNPLALLMLLQEGRSEEHTS